MSMPVRAMQRINLHPPSLPRRDMMHVISKLSTGCQPGARCVYVNPGGHRVNTRCSCRELCRVSSTLQSSIITYHANTLKTTCIMSLRGRDRVGGFNINCLSESLGQHQHAQAFDAVIFASIGERPVFMFPVTVADAEVRIVTVGPFV